MSNQETATVAIAADGITRRRLAAFYRFGMEGMTLMDRRIPEAAKLELESVQPHPLAPAVRAPRPLVKRCGCGRQVSNRRLRCLDCQHELLRGLALEITSQDLLDAVLERNFANTREETLAFLRPLLPFPAE